MPAPITYRLDAFYGPDLQLAFTISGCTALNMLFNRDINSRMERTRHRPLAAVWIEPLPAALMGITLLALGLLWSAMHSIPTFLVILIGAALNALVYTI